MDKEGKEKGFFGVVKVAGRGRGFSADEDGGVPRRKIAAGSSDWA